MRIIGEKSFRLFQYLGWDNTVPAGRAAPGRFPPNRISRSPGENGGSEGRWAAGLQVVCRIYSGDNEAVNNPHLLVPIEAWPESSGFLRTEALS
jgi:hypothetical protein